MNKFHYLLLLNILLTIKAVEISENETESDDIELKENAENVCIDQEVQNKILNITYIQSIVSTLFLFFYDYFNSFHTLLIAQVDDKNLFSMSEKGNVECPSHWKMSYEIDK